MSRRRKEFKPNRDIRQSLVKSTFKRDNLEEDQLEEKDEGPLLEDYQICTITSVLLLAIYAASAHPSVPGGDSGELINAAQEMGVAHPPGYPLFTLLAKLTMVVLRYGSLAWRVNFLTAVFSALAGGLLQMTVLKLTRDVGTSLLAVGLFSLSKLNWYWSVTAEVFSLNNVFIAALMLISVVFEITAQDEDENGRISKKTLLKVTYLGAFISGLSLCNQHTIVLYVIPIALWVLITLYKKQALSISVLIKIGLCFCLGLLPYIYLPISSNLNTARWTWGDQRTFQGFLKHILRQEYGTFQLGKDTSGQGFVAGISAYFEHCYNNLCGIGPVLAIAGCIFSIKIRHGGPGENSLFVFILMLASYVTFFAWRANLDISDPLFKGVVERFWLQSDIVVSVLASTGFYPLIRWLTLKILGEEKQSLFAVFTMIGGITIISLNLQNFQECNHNKNNVIGDFATAIMKKMPTDAIVLTKGDLPTNTLRYIQFCEDWATDVSLVDVEVLTYDWSLPMLRKFYPNVHFPGDFWHSTAGTWKDGRRSFTMSMLIKANIEKYQMFACIGMTERDTSWQKDYTLWPYGPCHRIVKKTEVMDPKNWAIRTEPFADQWKYPYNSFPNSSWEKVANDEMWNAKISSAFYMYSYSEQTKDPQVKKEFLLAAYDLYYNAIKANQESGRLSYEVLFPDYWHKNFALVCERLLYVESHHKKSMLCKTSVFHFEQYVLTNRGADPEIEGIVQAIINLRDRVYTYEQLDTIKQTFEPRV